MSFGLTGRTRGDRVYAKPLGSDERNREDMRRAVLCGVCKWFGRAGFLSLIALSLFAASDPGFAAERDRDAIRQVEQAFSKMGGRSITRSKKPLLMRAEGTLDLTVRKQGRFPSEPELVSFHETLAIDSKRGITAYDYHTRVNSDAEEWFRYFFDEAGRLLTVDFMNERAFWEAGNGLEEQEMGYLRILPHYLLRDALQHKERLSAVGVQAYQGQDLQAVLYALEEGPDITLLFDPETKVLQAAHYRLDLPARGDTQVMWVYEDYKDLEGGGRIPSKYLTLIGGEVLKEMTVVETGRGRAFERAILRPPGIVIPAPPLSTPVEEAVPAVTSVAPAQADEEQDDSLGDVRPVREGIYVAINIRPGFHVLFVEFKDFVVAFEAPSGWFELQQMPAFNWSAGETSGSIARRYIKRIHETIPDKPIRYLVLTHHHSDHAGGIRPFVAEGATILATAATVEAMQATLGGRYELEGSQDEILDHAPKFEIVTGEKLISDGKRKLRLIDVGPNPHSSSMLVGYLPAEKLLYQSDLFEPLPMPYFPSKERVPVMKWFVDWLDASKFKVAQVTAIHGTFFVTDEHLDTIRALE